MLKHQDQFHPHHLPKLLNQKQSCHPLPSLWLFEVSLLTIEESLLCSSTLKVNMHSNNSYMIHRRDIFFLKGLRVPFLETRDKLLLLIVNTLLDVKHLLLETHQWLIPLSVGLFELLHPLQVAELLFINNLLLTFTGRVAHIILI